MRAIMQLATNIISCTIAMLKSAYILRIIYLRLERNILSNLIMATLPKYVLIKP